jgi:hypothetical protein
MSVSPTKGAKSTVFTLTWAAAAPPAGFIYDVQIKLPAATSYIAWQSGVKTLKANFNPNAGIGTYSFRARVRSTSNRDASGLLDAGGHQRELTSCSFSAWARITALGGESLGI